MLCKHLAKFQVGEGRGKPIDRLIEGICKCEASKRKGEIINRLVEGLPEGEREKRRGEMVKLLIELALGLGREVGAGRKGQRPFDGLSLTESKVEKRSG